MAKAAGSDHDRSRAGAEHVDRPLDGMDRRQPRVGEGGDVLGLESLIQLDDRARRGHEQVGEAAVTADPRKRPVHAMHVVAAPARSA